MYCVFVLYFLEKRYLSLSLQAFDLENVVAVNITQQSYEWIEALKTELSNNVSEGKKVVVYSQGEPLCGIVGLTTCLIAEHPRGNIR